MGSAKNQTWREQEVGWLEVNRDSIERDCSDFFRFPPWYPNGVRAIYQNLLWMLFAHFRHEGMDAFGRGTVRGLINNYKREIVQLTEDPNKKPYDDPRWRDLLGGFSFLERNIVLQLVRLEYAAVRPKKEGLEYVADIRVVLGGAVSTRAD